MDSWINKIWKDPVGSKIIASVLMLIFTSIAGAVKTHFEWNGFVSILSINIPLWVLLLGVLLYIVLVWVLELLREPAFLKLIRIDNLYGFNWTWQWNFDKKTRRYKIVDLKPLCKTCNEKMRLESIYSRKYVCPNGHSCSSDKVKWGLAMATIQDKICERYKVDANKYLERVQGVY